MTPMWQISFETTAAAAFALSDALEPFADAVSLFEQEGRDSWQVRGIATAEPDRARVVSALSVAAQLEGVDIPEFEIVLLPEADWLLINRESFPPMRFGRFHVHGSHLRGSVPRGVIALEIDAAQAFGSGSHATTEGCLRTIGRLARYLRPRRVLDMGCGSGILAMAAAKIWPTARVTAVDVDPVSVATTRANARRNLVAARLEAIAGDGYAALAGRGSGGFDLVLANILAKPLEKMAPALRRQLAPGGHAVLSGLLYGQRRGVIAAHRAQGLALVGVMRIGDWATLVMRRRARGA